MAEPTAEELTKAIALAIRADDLKAVVVLLRALVRTDPKQAEAVSETIQLGLAVATEDSVA